ncbi:MAG: DsbC family protein [Burkholderiales bacterium]
MNIPKQPFIAIVLLALGGFAFAAPSAEETAIRANLKKRIPQIEKIDEVRKTPMKGLFEVRVNGSDIFYTDRQGNYLIHGNLIDTRARKNLTEERVEKLTAVDFKSLPLTDSFKLVRGNGERQLAVFEDPNCGYCKRFERDLQNVDNLTVHLFLYPILSADSQEKSKNIWCAKDPAGAWNDWMLREQPAASAECDAAPIERNLAFGRKYKITGTPTLIFADGKRIPGAISAAQVEQLLVKASGN